MLGKGYPKEKIKLLTNFIKEYVSFGKSEFNRKFDKHVEDYSQNQTNMGLYETIIEIRTDEAEKKGLEKGLNQGLEQGLAKGLNQGLAKGLKSEKIIKDFESKLEFIGNSLKLGISTDIIAKIYKVDKFVVEQFQTLINLNLQNPLKRDIKIIQAKISTKDYTITQLKIDLIRYLLAYQFTEKAVHKLLKVPLALVKKTKAKMPKK